LILSQKPQKKQDLPVVYKNFKVGLYVGDELKSDYYSEKDRKITYLTKIITLAEMMDGNKIPAKPQKIIAGLEPEFTNAMLQLIHRCATSGQPSDPYVKKILSGGGS
jgi:TRAF3-interacting protein 1